MNKEHDRAVGEEPWKVIPPIQQHTASSAIPDNAVWEGPHAYWIEGTAPHLRIMCGGAGMPYEVQTSTAWYPDEIHEMEQRLLREWKEGQSA